MTDTPPPRRPRTLRRVLLIAAVVMVVCCGGVVAVGFGFYKWFNSAAGAAEAAVDGYLGDLEAGRTSAAYAKTCPDFRAHVSENAFTGFETRTPTPRSHRITNTSVSNVNGQNSALIAVAVTRSDDSVQHVTIPLAAVGGTWYVCPENPLP